MATIDEILEMWEIDSDIDDNNIDSAAVNVPKLHSKYVKFLIQAKLKHTKLQNEFIQLKKIKFRYYRGELTRDELTELGWDQWQGTKPIKNEMDQFLSGDVELNNMTIKIEYIGSMIYLLESIMAQIKARDWQLRTITDWKKFIAGA